MKATGGTLFTLASFFAVLSLFAIGGGNSAVPEMHRFAVDVQQWMTDRQFADTFALAQLTPGPNLIIVTLIGYHVAGVLGALVTTLAMCGPTGVFAFFVGRASNRFRDAAWHNALSRGLVPITLGLTAASVALAGNVALADSGGYQLTLQESGPLAGGGSTINLGIHFFDLAVLLMGEGVGCAKR